MMRAGRARRWRPQVGSARPWGSNRDATVGCVQVTIRTYEPRDAAGVADVFYRSVREVARSDYTDEQVKAWVPGPLNIEQGHLRSSDGRLVLVAADQQDRVVGFVDFEPDRHIDRLYRVPEAGGRDRVLVCVDADPEGHIDRWYRALESVGRGIASRLYDRLEAAAREQGI